MEHWLRKTSSRLAVQEEFCLLQPRKFHSPSTQVLYVYILQALGLKYVSGLISFASTIIFLFTLDVSR